MKISLRSPGPDYQMRAENETGQSIALDYSGQGQPQGFSPMQLLLAGIAGCSCIDVRMILEKQRQQPSLIEVSVEGQRRAEPPRIFEQIHLHYTLYGPLDADKVAKALALSIEKYCSVAKMLAQAAEIRYDFELRPALDLD